MNSAKRPMRVLYAPTWEGFYEDSCYSSLLSMGHDLLGTLTAAPDSHVLHFKGHPLTGSADARFGQAQERFVDAARASRCAGMVMQPGLTLYDYFMQADVLITDISSVISDFLYLDRPIIVTNPLGMADMTTQFPIVRGCYVLDAQPFRLPELLADIASTDSLRAARASVREQVFGVPRGTAVEAFRSALAGLSIPAAVRELPPSSPPPEPRLSRAERNTLLAEELSAILAALGAHSHADSTTFPGRTSSPELPDSQDGRLAYAEAALDHGEGAEPG